MQLLVGKKNPITVAIDDMDWILFFVSWSKNTCQGKTYIRHTVKINGVRQTFFMHRIILERAIGRKLSSDEVVDHKNGDTLDNRRENLRIATAAQNSYNKGVRRIKAGGSIYKGINYQNGRWLARIYGNGKRINIGFFETEVEAAKAYDTVARVEFGEYARLNFPECQDLTLKK